jgi:hypothetical protein
MDLPGTKALPLCRPFGWVALWRRLAQCGTLNKRIFSLS